jgi:hypothetical protein
MSDFQKGINGIVVDFRLKLAARHLDGAHVVVRPIQSQIEGAEIVVEALGKTASAAFSRQEIDDCLDGVTVGIQVKIDHFLDQFGS